MTVEEIRDDIENFPVGMRVLAVDDDPICLKLLDTLLRKCQYHVTTTSQARMALKMLRENRDRFDLVISDVHMPDMDGFKLLELVGLEMDLPVIMLSANSDPKLVMKGVTHGACDYLVKPIRIEELRNIWQHVIRRKKFDAKNQYKSGDQVSTHQAIGEGHVSGNTDQNGKFNRKRKDEEDETEDNGNESEDPATQKKPRVVWSIDLHRKFVAAVNQLGIEKAVPKRILDLMNVDGLTRENVASHLQKYRLYLKRISSVATQQANMAAALGFKDSPFMRLGPLEGLGDFRSLSGARLANVGLSPFTNSRMLGRLNSPANVNLRNLTPPLVQQNQAPNLSNSIPSRGKLQPVFSPANQNANLFQGIPSSLELDQFHNRGATIDDSRMFTNASSFADPGAAIGGSSNLLNNMAHNTTMLQGNAEPTLSGGGFGNQSTHNMASFNSESVNVSASVSSTVLDPGKCIDNWQNTIESPSKMPLNPLLSTEQFHSQLPLNGSRDDNPSNDPFVQNNPAELSSGIALLPFEDLSEMQCQEGLVGDVQNMNQVSNHRWGEQRHNYSHSSNSTFGSYNSHIPANGTVSPLVNSLDQNSVILNQKMGMFIDGRSTGSASTHVQQNENEKLATESRVRSNEDFLLEQPKLPGGFGPQSYDSSLDELMNAMIKREQDETIPNCDFGFDDYAFGQGA